MAMRFTESLQSEGWQPLSRNSTFQLFVDERRQVLRKTSLLANTAFLPAVEKSIDFSDQIDALKEFHGIRGVPQMTGNYQYPDSRYGTPGYVDMEYIQGAESLSDNRYVLTPTNFESLTRQSVTTLQEMHARGRILLDIPSDSILHKNGQMYIVDYERSIKMEQYGQPFNQQQLQRINAYMAERDPIGSALLSARGETFNNRDIMKGEEQYRLVYILVESLLGRAGLWIQDDTLRHQLGDYYRQEAQSLLPQVSYLARHDQQRALSDPKLIRTVMPNMDIDLQVREDDYLFRAHASSLLPTVFAERGIHLSPDVMEYITTILHPDPHVRAAATYMKIEH